MTITNHNDFDPKHLKMGPGYHLNDHPLCDGCKARCSSKCRVCKNNVCGDCDIGGGEVYQ